MRVFANVLILMARSEARFKRVGWRRCIGAALNAHAELTITEYWPSGYQRDYEPTLADLLASDWEVAEPAEVAQ